MAQLACLAFALSWRVLGALGVFDVLGVWETWSPYRRSRATQPLFLAHVGDRDRADQPISLSGDNCGYAQFTSVRFRDSGRCNER